MQLALSITFGLLSMLGFGIANGFLKPLSQKYGGASITFLRGVTVVLVLAVATLIVGFDQVSNWPLAPLAFVLGLAGYLPVLAFIHALKETPLGIVSPIAGTAPLVGVLMSYAFLGVALSHGQWWAILVVIVANVAVTVEPKNWRSSGFFRKSAGIPFAFAAALGWGLFAFCLASIVKSLGPWLSTFLVEVGVTLAAYIHCRLLNQKVDIKEARHPAVIFNGLSLCLGTVALAIGAAKYNVGIVVALSSSTALVTTLVGVVFLRERIHVRDWIAGGAMVAGIAALSLL